jgi:hypothetical protein
MEGWKMIRRKTLFAGMGGVLVVASLGGGCLASIPETEEPPRRYAPAEMQPDLGISVVSNSGVDERNRYRAVLLVEGEQGMCSGTLIAPSLVATAGHCVCLPRAVSLADGSRGRLIDKATCSQSATVEVVTYGSGQSVAREEYTGTVKPHPQIKVLYNAGNKEVESNADLAVIALKEPLKGVKPIQLAAEQVRYAQPVTLVGFGKDMVKTGVDGWRRFGFNEVASIEESGAFFLVGKPVRVRRPYKTKEMVLEREVASYSLEGDSGGPCLRARGEAMELVGIAKTFYGGGELVQFSEYTSVYFYREWLRQEIARAEKKDTD